MMTFLIFIGTAFFLIIEGHLLCSVIARGVLTKCEEWALGFPLAAFLNALIFFLCTIFGISLTLITIGLLHGVMLLILVILQKWWVKFSPRVEARGYHADSCGLQSAPTGIYPSRKIFQNVLIVFLSFSIIIKLLYGISGALLPTYYYDSVSQWTHRSHVSYEDRAIAFDINEDRGISKPQYPILLHSLQIVFMLPQDEWNDVVANSATLLLTLTSFAAFFLFLLRRGLITALLTLATILMIPLLSEHLIQGHGDIHVLQYLLLSAIFLAYSSSYFYEGKKKVFLILSAIFIIAAAWCKQEGLVFGVLPWLLIVGFSAWKSREKFRVYIFMMTLLFGSAWSVFLLTRGLPLSPHGGGDFSLSWHGEAFIPVLNGLFFAGSFGVHWYVVLIMLFFIFIKILCSTNFSPCNLRTHWLKHMLLYFDLRYFILFVWGIITFLGTFFIYFCTPNVTYLLNTQTFSRTMMIPLVLFILTMAFLIEERE